MLKAVYFAKQMGSQQGKSKAEKLEDDLRRKTKIVAISRSEAERLLTHPLLAGLVDDRTKKDKDGRARSGGSHFWVVKVRDKAIAQYWGRDSFSVVCHNDEVKPVYVSDILTYLDHLRH
jgi:hypothetical protein